MDKKITLQFLNGHISDFPEEHKFPSKLKAFINSNDDYYKRSNLAGHITGSAWILSPDLNHALLIHHVKLNRWFQAGGHVDETDESVCHAALREAVEETGLNVTLIRDGVFDIDIHSIPERKGIPEHFHYDIRFLMKAESLTLDMNTAELKGIKWIALKDLEKDKSLDQSLRRMVLKSMIL